MKRRDFLSTTFLSASAIALPSSAAATPSVIGGITARKHVIRIAHLTDIHIKSDKIAEAGFAKALQSVQGLNPKPDFILNGGDSIMDALDKTKDEVKQQWTLYKNIVKAENTIPITHVIGNHDIWGWFAKASDTLKNDRLYGKAWVIDELKMPKRYYAFERSGWKFIVLDSTQLNSPSTYTAFIDPEQLEWLKAELAATSANKHICIASHIPILSMCSGLFIGRMEANGDLVTKNNVMHSDFFKLKNLFKNYPNIKVCLSGHVHLQDAVDYLGIKYYCNGAVCGAWWKGNYQDFPPAYAIVDYYDDGSFERCFVNY